MAAVGLKGKQKMNGSQRPLTVLHQGTLVNICLLDVLLGHFHKLGSLTIEPHVASDFQSLAE